MHCASIALQAELAAAAASAESDRRALHALEGRAADAESRARAAAAERDAVQRRAQEAANAAAGDSARALMQSREEASGLRDQLARAQARLEALQQQVRALHAGVVAQHLRVPTGPDVAHCCPPLTTRVFWLAVGVALVAFTRGMASHLMRVVAASLVSVCRLLTGQHAHRRSSRARHRRRRSQHGCSGRWRHSPLSGTMRRGRLPPPFGSARLCCPALRSCRHRCRP